jgi:tetrahydromethanopterin S-methyltransferase subunit G
MADLNDLIKSKKVKDFVRKEKNRPWTVTAALSPSDDIESKSTAIGPRAEAPTQRSLPSESKASLDLEIKRSQNVEQTKSERSQEAGQNVARTVAERSNNVAIEVETQPERRNKAGQNVARTVAERSQEAGQNVAINSESKIVDPTLLVGTQRRVFKYFFELAQQFASLKTPRLTLETMSASTGLSEMQVHSATKQLRQKCCIAISERKDGRGGWVEYSVNQQAFESWIRLESMQKRSQNVEITVAERSQEAGHKAVQTASSSSRDLYNKETTTTGNVGDFEFSVEVVAEFGLTASAIARCFELYPSIDREKMQDLINRFGQFMRTGEGKRVQNARGFFISLAKQLSEGITPLDHIETSEARLMRELVAKKKAQQAEVAQLEKEMRDFDFEEWWEELAPADRDALVKPNSISLSGSQSQKIMAKQVHAEKFWPERRTKTLSAATTADQ